MKEVRDMSDEEIVAELSTMTLLNRIRAKFYHGAAMLEQKDAQRKPPGSIQRRRMEFEIAEAIIREVQSDIIKIKPSAKQIEFAMAKLKSAHWHTVERTENPLLIEDLLAEAVLLIHGKMSAREPYKPKPQPEKIKRVRL